MKKISYKQGKYIKRLEMVPEQSPTSFAFVREKNNIVFIFIDKQNQLLEKGRSSTPVLFALLVPCWSLNDPYLPYLLTS